METLEIKTVRTYENDGHSCIKCGRRLINPGYNKTSTLCCGVSQPWGTWHELVVSVISQGDRYAVISQLDDQPMRVLRDYASLASAKRAAKRA